MGKPPLTDEERRVKDLTRELHEAMKEARQALKDLQAELGDCYQTQIHDALQADLDVASNAIREGVRAVDEHLQRLEKRIIADYKEITDAAEVIRDSQRDLLAKVTGFQSKEESARIFAEETARVSRALATDPVFGRLVATYVIAELDCETAGEFTGRAPANFDIMRKLGQATGGIAVRLADAEHPPGLYDEHMRPLDIRIVP
ncbi:MAG TPA: hypothetical protein VGR98_28045 [Streptosporangiaceae bacterium]|nr:hypothetical protein [Streptosporangiaceae bacterium]